MSSKLNIIGLAVPGQSQVRQNTAAETTQMQQQLVQNEALAPPQDLVTPAGWFSQTTMVPPLTNGEVAIGGTLAAVGITALIILATKKK